MKPDSLSMLTQKLEQERNQILKHQEEMELMQQSLKNSMMNCKEHIAQELNTLQISTQSCLKFIDKEMQQQCQNILDNMQQQTDSAEKLNQTSMSLLKQMQSIGDQAKQINLQMQSYQQQQQDQQSQQQQQQKLITVLSVSCIALLLIVIIILLVK
ncbi:hypothetical protein SDC9_63252 [bioreactor metagenome]|uniref:Uncharacterized protein n=1 Tax=bioreactor metagenome TaxID=1076179 RepID=A0A644XL09_9ZZZZ